jgi:hypothetical protein
VYQHALQAENMWAPCLAPTSVTRPSQNLMWVLSFSGSSLVDLGPRVFKLWKILGVGAPTHRGKVNR